MGKQQSFNITIPLDMAELIKAKVASGEYATESDVICAGLQILAARNAAMEQWLRSETAPAYDAHKADPTRALPFDDGMALVRARIATTEGRN